MKRIITLTLVLILLVLVPLGVHAEGATILAPTDLNSQSVILVTQDSGKILFDKNSHQKLFPASITKNMVALLAIENSNMDEMCTVGDEINLVAWDASKSGLQKGDQMSMADLVWALMLRSGNDAAYTIAVHVSRGLSDNSDMNTQEAVSYFVELMNQRAADLGTENTHFSNPDGYHAPDHYSTAYDLALIAQEAMKHELFREVSGTFTYTKEMTQNGTKKTSSWQNRNELLNSSSSYYYEHATGIKTGHTSDAGYCLASSAQKDGLSLIAITLKSTNEEGRWTDAKKILEYGLQNYALHDVVKKDQVVDNIKVVKKIFGDSEQLDVLADTDYRDILSKQDIENIQKTISWDTALLDLSNKGSDEVCLVGPITRGQIVGKVVYSLNGNVLAESNLVASRDAIKLTLIDKVVYAADHLLTNYLVIVVAAAIIIIAALVLWIRSRSLNSKGKYHGRF